jgi:predicted acetyltransferase
MGASELQIRPGRPEDWEAISRLLFTVFNDTFDEDLDRVERTVYEPERALVACDGAEVVANAAVFTRDMSVPGAVLPVAHVTMVGVLPTYRRQGVLRRLMRRQLQEIRDGRSEPVAALWASEGRIYPRFGYGCAAYRLGLEIDAREVRLADPPGCDPAASAPGRLRAAEPAAVRTELAKVYEQIRGDRPGWSSRDERWWEYLLADLPSRRHGATERRAVLHEGQSGVDGYALWRVRSSWDDAGPNGQVQAGEVLATNPGAYLALWRFLLSVDLTRSARLTFGAVDEPLLYLADEPRRLSPRITDSLWVRVVDVPAALSARRYSAPLDVVFAVTDDVLPGNSGRWRLVVDPAGAGVCTGTDARADLACDISVLGAAYLGGTPLGALAAAGRLTELRPGAVPAASAAFGWHRAPSALDIF